LTAAERRIAPRLYGALQDAVRRVAAGDRDFAAIERAGSLELEAAGMQSEYFAIRAAQTLAVPQDAAEELVVLAAARLGKARLIDNLKVS
jgi:pantoate--beta-alanine ligase